MTRPPPALKVKRSSASVIHTTAGIRSRTRCRSSSAWRRRSSAARRCEMSTPANATMGGCTSSRITFTVQSTTRPDCRGEPRGGTEPRPEVLPSFRGAKRSLRSRRSSGSAGEPPDRPGSDSQQPRHLFDGAVDPDDLTPRIDDEHEQPRRIDQRAKQLQLRTRRPSHVVSTSAPSRPSPAHQRRRRQTCQEGTDKDVNANKPSQGTAQPRRPRASATHAPDRASVGRFPVGRTPGSCVAGDGTPCRSSWRLRIRSPRRSASAARVSRATCAWRG